MISSYVSYYSAGNFGDDLFVYLLATTYKARFEVQLNRPSKSLESLENVTVRRDRILRALERILPHSSGLARRRARELRRSARNDLTVLIGGSLFIETGHRDDRARMEHYKSFSNRLVVLGANVGPVRTVGYVDQVKEVFRRAHRVVLRDSTSAAMIGPMENLTVASDLLLALPMPVRTTTHGSVLVSVVNPERKGYDSSVARAYYESIADFVGTAVAAGRQVDFVAFCPFEGDVQAADSVQALLPDDVRERTSLHAYRGDISDTLETILAAEYMLGSRFHASVLGFAAGMKVFPISYGGKLANLLADGGYDRPLINMSDFAAGPKTIHMSQFQQFDVSQQRLTSQRALNELATLFEQ